MSIRHVIFDWAGTLTPWRQVDALANWVAAARTLDPRTSLPVGEMLFAAEKQLMLRSRDEHISATVEQVCELAGVQPTDAALDAYRKAWESYTYTDAEGADVLSALRALDISVGVLSNTLWPSAWHREIFERDGVLDLINAAVYSSEMPWAKPHPKAFMEIMTALGTTDPASCCVVGDRLFEDVYGAQNVGMKAILVPHSRIPTEEIGANLGRPDAVVHRLSDLVGVIELWNA